MISDLIAIFVNLIGLLVIYSLLAFTLARLSWSGRGMMAVLATIVMAGQFWIVPTLLVRNSNYIPFALPFALAFRNWLISGFSVIIFCQAVRWIPRQLADSARLDGCGWSGIYWHVVLPLIRRELCLIAFLTLIATAPLLVTPIAVLEGQFVTAWFLWFPVKEGFAGLAQSIGLMMGLSLVATLPMVLVFVFSKGPLLRDDTPTN